VEADRTIAYCWQGISVVLAAVFSAGPTLRDNKQNCGETGKGIMRALLALCITIVAISSELRAQTTATLAGRVVDNTEGAVAGAAILVENRLTGFRVEAVSDHEGAFSIRNIPFQAYS